MDSTAHDLRVRLEELVDQLPAQGTPEYSAPPTESAKYTASLIAEKVSRRPANLEARVSEDGPTLLEHAAARGYVIDEKGALSKVPVAVAAEPEAAPKAEPDGKALLERIAQRRMQQTVTGQEKPAEVPRATIGRMMQTIKLGGTGYAAQLKRKLERTGGQGFGSGVASISGEDDSNYTLLREWTAQKVERELGKRPTLIPQEIFNRLKSDNFIAAELHHDGEKFKTTDKGFDRGVTAAIKQLGIPAITRTNTGRATLVFKEKDLIEALEKRPAAFISIYQQTSDLTSHEIVQRLQDRGHLYAPPKKEDPLVQVKTGDKPAPEKPTEFFILKSQAMEDALSGMQVIVGLKKKPVTIGHTKDGPVIPKPVIFALLGQNAKVFDSLAQDPIALTHSEVVIKLLDSKKIYKVRNHEGVEWRAQGEEAVHLLKTLGVKVEYGKGGGRHIHKESLMGVLDEPTSKRIEALKPVDREYTTVSR